MDEPKDKLQSYLNSQEEKQKVENHLYNLLKEKLDTKDGFVIEQQVKWGPTSDPVTFDIVVSKDKYITTIIEVQLDVVGASLAGIIMTNYVFKNTQAPLFIVYCIKNESFYVYFRKKIGKDEVFLDNKEEKSDRYENKEIKGIDNVIACIKEESKKYISMINNLDHQLDLRFYEEKVLDPKWCREKLGVFEDNQICRYSSLDSLFSTLKYGTFRMNGLPGMNDKDEGLFAWYLINKPETKRPNDVNERKSLINNAFIISYSYIEKADDLIQWRLYGDDAKGVCSVYSIQKDKIKDRFFLHPIKYIKPLDDGQIPGNDLLNNLKSYANLKYADVSPIIYFYKHKAYEAESEVRLLVDNKKTSAYNTPEFKRDWLLTNSNKIPNPYIDIPIKDFPLKLEKIILGPNINDPDTIQVQLETMLDQLGINATVEPSTITSYRNPTK